MDFKNRIALVTGSTSGIGKEIAKQLLINGATVIINDVKSEKENLETLNEFEEYGSRLSFFQADISNEEEVINMYDKIAKKYEYLDYLVNNAGISINDSIEKFSLIDFKKVMDINFIGKVICTKYAIPLLRKSEKPSIVNVSSGLGIKPVESSSSYCAAAAAIINFTQASALELAKHNIRVNSICPGFTPTSLSLNIWSNEEIEYKKLANPLRRSGKPIDMANATLFLLSDKASYITGENISINGGSKLK